MDNSAAGALLQTPIHGWHKSKNAKLADFGGWEMPIEYGDYLNQAGEKGGVIAEHNCVREIFSAFTADQISAKVAQLVTPEKTQAEVEVIFQTIDGLHNACPEHTGDWYFTGDYPTPGGNKVVNRAFINWMEKRNERAY